VKVLQVNSVCGVGSTGRIATDIHNILIKQGHESYIAYGRGTPLNCNNAIRIGNNYDNYTHLGLTRLFDKHGFGSIKATQDFIKKVECFNPDIIHLHNIHGYYINIKILFEYIKKANKPVIWTLHDCWSFTGHCSHFDFIGCQKWKSGCYECPQKLDYPKSITDNSQSNYLNKKEIFTSVNNLTVVTPSNWLAELVEHSYLGEYPVKVINNGVDLQIFKPTESNFRSRYGLNDKFLVLGVASVWSERKGLDTFVRMANKLGEDTKIILVGISSKQKLKLPSNILVLEKTNNIAELAEIYSAANVFVNPTLEDNFPTTNLEALACGTPVITYDTGGSVESVSDGCGFVCEKGNLDELISNISRIKKDDKIKYQLNCSNISKMYYDKTIAYEKYIDLYNGYC
jgi:putative colanic acid biosynthesis glycosyltransferase